MKIRVNKDSFLKAFAVATRVVETKTTIPILSNVLMETVSASEVKLSATDLDGAIRVTCDADVVKEGIATVPARKLLDYLKLLPAGDVTMELAENNWMKISAGRSRTKMVGISPDNFPKLPGIPSATTAIKTAVLEDLISKTIFAISKEESRYTLSGALMILGAKGARMVATDVHRMAVADGPGEYHDARILIPLKALNHITSILDGEESIEFAHDDANLYFRCGNRLFSTRKLVGQFPNYEAVLPKSQPITITAAADVLGGALRRVSQFADERSGAVRVRLDSNMLTCSAASTEVGSSEESVEVAYDGQPLSIGFNGNYLLDFLRGADGKVDIQFKDSHSAAEFRLSVRDDYRYVVMPMRV